MLDTCASPCTHSFLYNKKWISFSEIFQVTEETLTNNIFQTFADSFSDVYEENVFYVRKFSDNETYIEYMSARYESYTPDDSRDGFYPVVYAYPPSEMFIGANAFRFINDFGLQSPLYTHSPRGSGKSSLVYDTPSPYSKEAMNWASSIPLCPSTSS